jgi:hypothetical protein
MEAIADVSVGRSMPLTLRDVMSKLTTLDEITLLEVLEITSEELVERFIDKVENKYDQLEKELDD